MEQCLACRHNGIFTVLIVADPQCENDAQWQEAERELETLTTRAEPDLVVINGDMETNNRIPHKGFATMIRPLTERNIPFVVVNGNHDPFTDESYRLYRSFPNNRNILIDEKDACFEKARPMNFCMPVYSHDGKRIVFAIYGMDTGDYANGGWDGATEKQVAWYRKTADDLRLRAGTDIPALLCCHIAFSEVRRMQVLDGIAEEIGAVTAKQNDKGLFDAIKEKGDVKLAVFGHSHTINQIGVCDGVVLAYAGKLSTGSYHNTACRGGRVVTFYEAEPAIIKTKWLASLPQGKDQAEFESESCALKGEPI